MIDGEKSPCITCEVHMSGVSKNTSRCGNCPDKKDYLLKIDGKEPVHRRFNPTVLGYKKFDPVASVLPKPSELIASKRLKPSSVQCIDCKKWFPIDEMDKYFYKNNGCDSHMKRCKKCHNVRTTENSRLKRLSDKKIAKKEKEAVQAVKPKDSDSKSSTENIKDSQTIVEESITPKTVAKEPDQKIKDLEASVTIAEGLKTVTVRVCATCKDKYVGKDDIEKNFGRHNTAKDGFYKSCRKCVKKERMANPNFTPYKDRKTHILLDFRPYPDLLKALEEEAKKDFRDPSQQIFHILSTHCKEN